MARVDTQEKLWRYPALVRLWAKSLLGVAVAMLVVSGLVQAGSESGFSLRWVGVALGISGATGAVFYPLLRMWLRKSSPSEFLPRAKKLSGPRRLEAGPRDWQRWAVVTTIGMFVVTTFMLISLIGVLRESGPEGIVEGVVVGVLAAWGLVTLEDARKIERIETSEGRRYFAAGRRPTGAGHNLVWTAGATTTSG